MPWIPSRGLFIFGLVIATIKWFRFSFSNDEKPWKIGEQHSNNSSATSPSFDSTADPVEPVFLTLLHSFFFLCVFSFFFLPFPCCSCCSPDPFMIISLTLFFSFALQLPDLHGSLSLLFFLEGSDPSWKGSECYVRRVSAGKLWTWEGTSRN